MPGNWAGLGGVLLKVVFVPSPNSPYCCCIVCVCGGVIFHSFDLDSSVPLEALTYFSVKSQRRGRWWVSATPLTCTPGLLKSSDLSEIWESREAQGARYVTLKVDPGAAV